MGFYAILIWCFTLILGLVCFEIKAESINKSAKERLLFFHSYPVGERGKKINDGLRTTITNKYPNTEYRFESLDYRKLENAFQQFDRKIHPRFDKQVQEERQRLHSIITKFKPSILILSDDEVGEIIHPLPKSFKGSVFFMGMNRKLEETPWYRKNPSQYKGGISDNIPVERSVSVLKKLIPLKKVALVTSKGMTAQVLTDYMESEIKRVGLEVSEVIQTSDWSEWKRRLSDIDQKVDLIWMLIPYQVYENGKEVKLKKIGQWMVENLKTPTAGVSDVNVKMGIWFAQASDSHAIGAQLGEQIVSYLNKGKKGNMGIEPRLSYDFIMNSQTAKKLHIQLPESMLGFIRMIYNEGILEKPST